MYQGDTAVARFEPVKWRRPFALRIVDPHGEPLATLHISDSVSDARYDIEFAAAETTGVFRMLTIALAYSSHREITEIEAASSVWD
jgi:hypothetical protein